MAVGEYYRHPPPCPWLGPQLEGIRGWSCGNLQRSIIGSRGRSCLSLCTMTEWAVIIRGATLRRFLPELRLVVGDALLERFEALAPLVDLLL